MSTSHYPQSKIALQRFIFLEQFEVNKLCFDLSNLVTLPVDKTQKIHQINNHIAVISAGEVCCKHHTKADANCQVHFHLETPLENLTFLLSLT